ncbi:hypothetical protein AAL_02399 [Moelleriella libera RCEF 2490]|uniref:Alpha-N-acetylglucosaminidase N-terminal domain-containing protein n=1 Tax=Moelleriella libera RCEF 2490 TaxID=1081109 RepID=A0A168EJ11_9HYPO|nr:hypothetical protein AAL_02399 [Moelleriella libera RCEF 2490]
MLSSIAPRAMRWLQSLLVVASSFGHLPAHSSAATGASSSLQPSTSGIAALANRLLPGRAHDFEFRLTASDTHEPWSRWNYPPVHDNYTVSAEPGGRILIEGTTLSALSRG